jgi:hypothetical protein
MPLSYSAFNHRLDSIRRDLQELRAEKVHRVSNVWTGWSIAIIADFVISLAKLDRGPKGRLQVIGTMDWTPSQPLCIEGAGPRWSEDLIMATFNPTVTVRLNASGCCEA